MDNSTAHPNQSLLDQQVSNFRGNAGLIAHWVKTTDPSKLDWVPGDPEITKARTIYDQIGELVTINKRRAAVVRGEDPGERVPLTFSSADEACNALTASAEEMAAALIAAGPEALDRDVEGFSGPMRLRDFNDILLMNMAYHGGVINAYQMMYGDDTFRYPGMDE